MQILIYIYNIYIYLYVYIDTLPVSTLRPLTWRSAAVAVVSVVSTQPWLVGGRRWHLGRRRREGSGCHWHDDVLWCFMVVLWWCFMGKIGSWKTPKKMEVLVGNCPSSPINEGIFQCHVWLDYRKVLLPITRTSPINYIIKNNGLAICFLWWITIAFLIVVIENQ